MGVIPRQCLFNTLLVKDNLSEEQVEMTRLKETIFPLKRLKALDRQKIACGRGENL